MRGHIPIGRVVRLMLSRPQVRDRPGFRRRTTPEVGLSLRPNAPRLVTVAAAVVLTVVGLAVTVYPIDAVLDLLAQADVTLTREQGWTALLGSPALLVLGSFLRGL